MTSTVLDILTRTARALGLVPAGGEPSGNDAEDLLQRLQDTIDGLPLLRNGEWADVFLASAAAYAANDGERVFTNGHAATITLPATFSDAETGATKATLDLARVQVVGSGHAQEGLWVYCAARGSWASIDGLATSDDSPFGPEDDAGLAALTAIGSVDEYGSVLSAATVARAEKALKSFRARFYREVPVATDEAFLVMSDTGRTAGPLSLNG